ncbi:putative ribonuclease H-like domain-containing protein [Tanacetum coccineum]
MPPTPDLSFTGLDEFVNEPVVESYKAMSSEEEPKIVKKNNDAPIIKEWVSDDEEEDASQPKTEKKIVRPSIVKKKFVKSKQQEKSTRKTVKQDQGVIDSRCSRHMTGNMSYLTDYEEIDGGYVAFGGNPKGGKITGKGTIKTGNLDFENVYFMRELKFNLFSVSQMCDKKNSVLFNDTECIVLSPNFKLIDESQVLLRVPRKNNMYSVDLKNIVPNGGLTCLFAKATSNESKLYHRRLGHLNFKTMNKLVKGNLVRGLPSKLFENDQTCVACQKGKHHRASSTKDETSGILKSFITGIENLVYHKVKMIRCDNGTEFKNREMNQFCEMKGILRQFSVARTPQQNRVAERRNRTLIEAARTMLADSKLPTTFWAEAVNTACYITKFDGKADECFFVGYSLNSKAFRVFNSRTRIVEENLHIRFSESTPNVVGSGPDWLFDIDALTRTMNYEPIVAGTQSNGFAGTKASDNAGQARKETEPVKDYILLPLWTADPPYSQDPKSSHDDGSKPSSDDGKKVDEDPRKDSECNDQEKEDNVNSTNNVNAASTNEVNVVGGKTSIKLPFDPNMPALEDYSIFDFSSNDKDDDAENKKDERGIVIRNKARLVAQGYTQEEGIDYDEVFSLVARIEAIRLFLAYASFKDFVVYQMDVKSVFLYGKIEEEVYVCQPLGFEDPDFPNRVYKVEKALYGLHQAPKAWHKGDILLVQVYVDDIIFGSTKKELCLAFEKLMHEKFQMSSIGERTFFLGIQVKQKKDGIFISEDKYVEEILKKFRFIEVKTASTPMETQNPLLKDEDGKEVDVYMYRSMIGSLMYLTSSRSDIMFVVCTCARYQVNPKVSHLHVVKRIFSARNRQWLQIPQQKLSMWLLQVDVDKCFGFRINYMIMGEKTVNGEVQLQALVDRKKIVITESTIRRDLQLEDAKGTDCLPNATIFEQLTLMGMVRNVENVSGKFLMYPRFVQVFVNQQVGDMSTHKMIYVIPSHTKKIFGNMKREGKADEEVNEENVLKHSNDPCSVVRLAEIEELMALVKRLEKKKRSRTHGLRRLYKVGLSRRVESFDEASLGDQEDASKQGMIADIDADAGITLASTYFDTNIDMFGVHDLDGDEVFVEKDVLVKEVSVVEKVTAAATTVSAATITKVDITLAQALAELKSEKPKTTTTIATTIVTPARTRPRAKGFVIHEEEQAPTPTPIIWKRELVEGIEKKEGSKKAKAKVIECSSKRAGDELEQENAKKQKMDDAKETAELQSLMKIVPDEEEVAIDAIPLATKPPTIVDYKIIKEGKISFFQIIRADGSSKRYSAFI